MKLRKDVMNPSQRHKAMANNRGRTKPERKLASALWKEGFRFFTSDGYKKLSGKILEGKPDLIFPSKQALIFVDGCFWHGCSKCKGIPRDSGKAWEEKITKNIERDKKISKNLRKEGWTVIRIWEHSLKTKIEFKRTIEALSQKLRIL